MHFLYLKLFKISFLSLTKQKMFVVRYPCQGTSWGCLNIYDRKGQYLKICHCLFLFPFSFCNL
jgi:hypothetical protein